MSIAPSCFHLRILPLAAVILAAGCAEKHPRVEPAPTPVVLVSQPVERTVTDYQVFTARTQAVRSVDVKARVTGYLTRIRFKDGDEVEEGEVLFQIDDRPYKATLDQAKAAVNQGKAALTQAKAGVDIAKAALVKTQADYDIGKKIEKNNPEAISKQELNKRLGARDEAKGNVAGAEAGVPKAEAALEQAQANLETAQLNYDWCQVASPLTGRINRHFVDVGNVVTRDMTTLTNIVSLKPTWAYFDVDENTLRRYQELLRKGDVKAVRRNEIPVAMALAGDKDFPVKGVIDFVSNQVDPNTGSIRLRAVFPNDGGTLVAGLFGRIRVPTSAAHPALLVIDSAIGTNQGQKYVLVVNDHDEVEYRAVDVGQMHGGLREVKRFREVTQTGPDGQGVLKKVEVLQSTDRVIVDGLQRVRPGVQVKPKPVDMATLLVKPGPRSK